MFTIAVLQKTYQRITIPLECCLVGKWVRPGKGVTAVMTSNRRGITHTHKKTLSFSSLHVITLLFSTVAKGPTTAQPKQPINQLLFSHCLYLATNALCRQLPVVCNAQCPANTYSWIFHSAEGQKSRVSFIELTWKRLKTSQMMLTLFTSQCARSATIEGLAL